MHPVVLEFLKTYDQKPECIGEIFRTEDPIISQDGERVAYYRSENHRDIERRTVCSVHRYLSQRFEAPEWAITEACNKWSAKVATDFASHEFKIVEDVEEMIDLVHTKCGRVRSCMVDPNKFPNPAEHPYRAYDPSHGWALAVRMKRGQVMARTILHRFPGKPYTFSRVYGPSRDGSDATSGDNLLEAWLDKQGIKRNNDLEGATLARVEVGTKLLLPYLDAGNSGYRLHDDHLEIVDGYENAFDAQYASGYEESCPVWGGGRDFFCSKYRQSSDGVLIPLDKAVHTSLGWQHRGSLNLVTTFDGMEAAYFDSVKLYDGRIASRYGHPIQTLADGRFALRSECTHVNGQWYLTSEAPAPEPTIPKWVRGVEMVRPGSLCVGDKVTLPEDTSWHERRDELSVGNNPRWVVGDVARSVGDVLVVWEDGCRNYYWDGSILLKVVDEAAFLASVREFRACMAFGTEHDQHHLQVTLGCDIALDRYILRITREGRFTIFTSSTTTFSPGTAIASLIALDLNYDQAAAAWTTIEGWLQENPASGTTIMVPIPPTIVVTPLPQDRAHTAVETPRNLYDQVVQRSQRWTLSESPPTSEWSHEGYTYTPILPPIVEQP